MIGALSWLLSWVLLSTVLALCLTGLSRIFTGLTRWPLLAPLLLLLSLLPLLPWPEAALRLPEFWLRGHGFAAGPVLALPAHPGWTEQQGWPVWLTDAGWLVLLSGAGWQLWRAFQQWRQWRLLQAHAAWVPASLLAPVLAACPSLQARWQALQPQVRQLPVNSSPFVSGLRRPVLWLPDWFWSLENTQQQLLLNHELHHLQRKDPLWFMLWHLLCLCGWFNPALRLLQQHFLHAVETSVDNAVLQQFPQQRALYARTLLLAAKAQQQHQPLQRTQSNWQVAAGLGSARQMRCRLQHIMRPAAGLTWRAKALILGLLLSLSLPALALRTGLTGLAPTQWQAPLQQGRLSSAFGEIFSFRQLNPHGGIDLVAPRGAAVLAVAAGKVLLAGEGQLHPNLGLVVLLDHGGGYQTLYAHLDRVDVSAGQQLTMGTPVGTLGNSGRTTGPHLHLEILKDGARVDPATLLPLRQLAR